MTDSPAPCEDLAAALFEARGNSGIARRTTDADRVREMLGCGWLPDNYRALGDLMRRGATATWWADRAFPVHRWQRVAWVVETAEELALAGVPWDSVFPWVEAITHASDVDQALTMKYAMLDDWDFFAAGYEPLPPALAAAAWVAGVPYGEVGVEATVEGLWVLAAMRGPRLP